jgi:hypothetical protein
MESPWNIQEPLKIIPTKQQNQNPHVHSNVKRKIKIKMDCGFNLLKFFEIFFSNTHQGQTNGV